MGPHRNQDATLSKPSVSVLLLSRVWLFVIPWTAAHQASLSIIKYRTLLKLMFTESVMLSNHIILCHPLFLPPSIFPSIRVFSNESALCVRWPKYWSFSFNISPSDEHPVLISFRIDWLDLLAVQATLKSLLQHYNSKASILQFSGFFAVQFSHPCITTGKTIALTTQSFVAKVIFLLSAMLSRFVVVFLPRSKRLLVSWLKSRLLWFFRCCYIRQLVVFSDSVYKWRQAVFVFLCLTWRSQPIHVVAMGKSPSLLNGWAVSHWACVLYLFICWGTLQLPPHLGTKNAVVNFGVHVFFQTMHYGKEKLRKQSHSLLQWKE